ncbi:MAG: glycoside hydrolase family 27 protein [Terriglobia bacterium]
MKRLKRSIACVVLISSAVFVIGASSTSAQEHQAPLAATPPMGWNDWYQFECKVTDSVIRAAADALVSSGMKAAGYEYVNVDDCWQGQRDPQGFIQPNERFPDMKELADYIHSKGLKFGLYTSPGLKTCAGYEGSYGHEEQDARTYARWGVDFLKYDWCSAETVYPRSEMPTAYKRMHDALLRTGRPMVFSLCQYGLEAVWKWGPAVGGNLWRTTDDIGGDYSHWSVFGFQQDGLEKYAGPGHWNDPDILQIGIGKTNDDEDRTQMTLWCILAAPLLAGNDLTKMRPETLAILTNPEVIAVDQDQGAVQGRRVWDEGPLEIWMKPLADGGKAVALFNRSTGSLPMTLRLHDIGFDGRARVRDLWAKKDLGILQNDGTFPVPPHGAILLKVTGVR